MPQKLLEFFKNLNNEAKDAGKLMIKYMKKGKLTSSEEKELCVQFYDLLKIIGIGVPFVLIPEQAYYYHS